MAPLRYVAGLAVVATAAAARTGVSDAAKSVRPADSTVSDAGEGATPEASHSTQMRTATQTCTATQMCAATQMDAGGAQVQATQMRATADRRMHAGPRHCGTVLDEIRTVSDEVFAHRRSRRGVESGAALNEMLAASFSKWSGDSLIDRTLPGWPARPAHESPACTGLDKAIAAMVHPVVLPIAELGVPWLTGIILVPIGIERKRHQGHVDHIDVLRQIDEPTVV